jgi:hypothetical protein
MAGLPSHYHGVIMHEPDGSIWGNGKIVYQDGTEKVVWHKPQPARTGSETHHRSCAMRLGGDSCTC